MTGLDQKALRAAEDAYYANLHYPSLDAAIHAYLAALPRDPLRDAAPELLAVARGFKLMGPNHEGFYVLTLTEWGTSRRSMLNLGKGLMFSGEIIREAEKHRQAAIAKAEGTT